MNCEDASVRYFRRGSRNYWPGSIAYLLHVGSYNLVELNFYIRYLNYRWRTE